MNRHERRVRASVVTKATKKTDKFASELMKGPPGPWIEMSEEEYRRASERSLALSTMQHGSVHIPGPYLREVRKAWYNNHFEVLHRPFTCEWGAMDHLWVRRIDRKPIRAWGDLQAIKNALLPDGPQRTAVEVYPPEDSVLDQNHWYHLWVLPAGFELPFTLDPRKM